LRLIASLAALSLAVGCSGDRPSQSAGDRVTGGPLRSADDYVSFRQLGPVGSRFSEGFIVLRTKTPVTLESVEVTGGDQAIRYLGTEIGLPGRPYDFNQFMKGFPPRTRGDLGLPAKFQQPLRGSKLVPGESYMLVIGYQVERHVMDFRRAVTVNYADSDGTLYTRTWGAGIVTCPPPDFESCSDVAHDKYGDLLKLVRRH
jgi:hypothetical protein